MLQVLYHFASISSVVLAWIPRRSWRLLLIANFISSKLASTIIPSSTPRKKIFVFDLPHDFIKIISLFCNMTLSLFVVVRWSIIVFFCVSWWRLLRLFLVIFFVHRWLMLRRTKTHVRREKSSEKSVNGQMMSVKCYLTIKNTPL